MTTNRIIGIFIFIVLFPFTLYDAYLTWKENRQIKEVEKCIVSLLEI